MKNNLYRKIYFVATLAVTVFGLNITSHGQNRLVYENGIGGAAFVSAGYNADQDIPEYPVDDVTMTAETRVSMIAWTGFYGFNNNVPATENFTIAIHADNGGSPQSGPPIAEFNVGDTVNRVFSGVNINFLGTLVDVFNYSANIDFVMEENTTYWIGVYTNSVGHSDDFRWAGINGSGNQHSTSNSGSTWSFGGHRLDFRLFEEPLYDNGIGGSLFVTSGYNADQDIPEFAVDDITPVSNSRIRQVAWTGFYGFNNSVPATEDFRIDIFAENGGVPQTGAPLASFDVGNAVNRTDSGANVDFFGTSVDVFDYVADINFPMQAGLTYWIGVYTNSSGHADNFAWAGINGGGNQHSTSNSGASWALGGHRVDFRLFGIESPSNDNWINTSNAGGFPISIMSDNIAASTENGEEELDDTGSTVWYFFNAPGDGMVTLDTFGSNYDTQLYIFDGFAPGIEVSDLNPVIGNDDAPDSPDPGGLTSKVTFQVENGVCYEIRVGGYASGFLATLGIGDEGNFQLNGSFEEGAVLLGDVNCDNAVNLLDVAPFVDVISNGDFDIKADMNEDGTVNLLDVQPFIDVLSGG